MYQTYADYCKYIEKQVMVSKLSNRKYIVKINPT